METVDKSVEKQLEQLEQDKQERKDWTRQNRWHRRHLVSVGTKLRRNYAERFLSCCERVGVKPYTIVRNLVLQWTADQEREAFPRYYERHKSTWS